MYTSARRLNVFVHLDCFRITFFKYYLCVSIRVCVFMYAHVYMGVWNMCLCVFVCAYVHVCVHLCMYEHVFV